MLTTVVISSALAGTTISGDSIVYPGGSYTYTITVTETASSIMGTVESSRALGVQTDTWSMDSSSGMNESLTASATITVTVPNSAEIGSKGKITVSGQGSSYDQETGKVTKFNISGSQEITVAAPPTPAAWESAIKNIKKAAEGSSIAVEMNADNKDERHMPVEVLKVIKERNITLTVDFSDFKCIMKGNEVGDVLNDFDYVDLGYTMLPAERANDMIVFTPNNTDSFSYAVTYVLKPNLPLPEDTMFVYRHYSESGRIEYIDNAETDDEGNVLVYVYTPGQYIVSAKIIEEAVGNMDMTALAETSAKPMPTPVPTFTSAPQPSATPIPKNNKTSNLSVWLLVILAVLVVLMAGAIGLMKRNQNINAAKKDSGEI